MGFHQIISNQHSAIEKMVMGFHQIISNQHSAIENRVMGFHQIISNQHSAIEKVEYGGMGFRNVPKLCEQIPSNSKILPGVGMGPPGAPVR